MTRTQRRARALLLALALALVAYTAHTIFAIGDPVAGFWDRVYNGIEFGAAAACLMRARALVQERRAWILLAVGMACFGLGDLYWTLVLTHAKTIPVPSPADAGYLLFYPFAYAALLVLVRTRSDRFSTGIWLEGLVGSLAVAALGSALLEKPIQSATGGS